MNWRAQRPSYVFFSVVEGGLLGGVVEEDMIGEWNCWKELARSVNSANF